MNFELILKKIKYTDKYENSGSILWSWNDLIKSTCKFLCEGGNKKILDVGSGVGKYCIKGAHYNPSCHFYGVELDEDRHNIAVKIQDILTIKNATFIHDNFINLDFNEYDGIFIFNPFNMGGLVVHNEGKVNEYYKIDKKTGNFIFNEETGCYALNPEYETKRNLVSQFIQEMNKYFLEKVYNTKSGTKVVSIGMHFDLEKYGFKKVSNNFYIKV